MSLILRAAVVTDLGLVRTNNEDSAHVGPRVLAVADGIGGMPAGELASDIVIRALAALDEAPDQSDPLSSLRAAVDAANEQIREASQANDEHDGMGTTVTALMLSGDWIGLLHVGDSRCYLYRNGSLSQLTKDDTFVQSLVDQGLLSAEEARRHPRRSLVTQAVQGVDYVPTCTVLSPRPADRYLLCSDGLSDVIADTEIAEALQSCRDPQHCAETLVKLALEAGAPDNVTVIVADVLSPSSS